MDNTANDHVDRAGTGHIRCTLVRHSVRECITVLYWKVYSQTLPYYFQFQPYTYDATGAYQQLGATYGVSSGSDYGVADGWAVVIDGTTSAAGYWEIDLHCGGAYDAERYRMGTGAIPFHIQFRPDSTPGEHRVKTVI